MNTIITNQREHKESYESNNSIWAYLTHTVDVCNDTIKCKVLNTISELKKTTSNITIDKVGVAIAVTRFWARSALYAAKLTQRVCEFILMSPDHLFSNEPIIYKNEKIKIHHAATETQTITKKFRWWLQRCLNEERPLDNISVDFERFAKTFGAQALYCCYSVLDSETKMVELTNQINNSHAAKPQHQILMQNIKHLFIAKLQEKIIAQIENLTGEKYHIESEFGEFNFINEEKTTESANYIDRSIIFSSLPNLSNMEPVMFEPIIEDPKD